MRQWCGARPELELDFFLPIPLLPPASPPVRASDVFVAWLVD